jgi:hypothetical protein
MRHHSCFDPALALYEEKAKRRLTVRTNNAKHSPLRDEPYRTRVHLSRNLVAITILLQNVYSSSGSFDGDKIYLQ